MPHIPCCWRLTVISVLMWRSLSLCPALPVGKHGPDCCFVFSRTPYASAKQVENYVLLKNFLATFVQQWRMGISWFFLSWASFQVQRPRRGPKDGLLQDEYFQVTCMSNYESPCKLEWDCLLHVSYEVMPLFYTGGQLIKSQKMCLKHMWEVCGRPKDAMISRLEG